MCYRTVYPLYPAAFYRFVIDFPDRFFLSDRPFLFYLFSRQNPDSHLFSVQCQVPL